MLYELRRTRWRTGRATPLKSGGPTFHARLGNRTIPPISSTRLWLHPKQFFVDRVNRALSGGDVIAMIVGDGIETRLQELVHHLCPHRGKDQCLSVFIGGWKRAKDSCLDAVSRRGHNQLRQGYDGQEVRPYTGEDPRREIIREARMLPRSPHSPSTRDWMRMAFKFA